MKDLRNGVKLLTIEEAIEIMENSKGNDMRILLMTGPEIKEPLSDNTECKNISLWPWD